ncbi:unnamed protein product, partial [Nesidiocoris tenuis]
MTRKLSLSTPLSTELLSTKDNSLERPTLISEPSSITLNNRPIPKTSFPDPAIL